jgi:hypothetical protein
LHPSEVLQATVVAQSQHYDGADARARKDYEWAQAKTSRGVLNSNQDGPRRLTGVAGQVIRACGNSYLEASAVSCYTWRRQP